MSRIRVVLLTIVAACGLGWAAPAEALLPIFPTRTATPTPGPTPAGLPDLVPELGDLSLQLDTSAAAGDVAEGCAEATSGVDLLRFTVWSRNVGGADLAIGDPRCPTPCADHPLEVCGNPDFVCSPAAGHDHPHYASYARYELLNAQGSTVVVGHKQGFCLRDTSCGNGGTPVYDCSDQGISAGCADLYHASLGCQYLDVTGVPAGSYLLRVTLDPLGQIVEESDGNNVVQTNVTILRPGEPMPSRTRTPTPARTPTSSPSRTPTPARTATPVGTATDGAPPTSVPTPSPMPIAADVPACQRAILGAGRVLVGRTVALLDACTGAVAACESPRRRTAACDARARTVCAAAVAALEAAESSFTSRVTGRCAALDEAALRLASGLGFARRDDACAARYGATTDSLPGIVTCVARQHVCRAGALVATEDPRTGARLARGGALATGLCIADVGGAGREASELAETRALEACGRTLRRAARTFTRRRLASLQRCVAAEAACLGAPAQGACRARAAASCGARSARLDADGPRLAATITRGCGALDFALVRSEIGLHLGATAECAAYGVPALDSLDDYVRCLAGRHACAIDEIVRFEAPRADEWVATWPTVGACPAEPD